MFDMIGKLVVIGAGGFAFGAFVVGPWIVGVTVLLAK